MGIAVVPKNPVDVAGNLKNPEGVAVDPKNSCDNELDEFTFNLEIVERRNLQLKN